VSNVRSVVSSGTERTPDAVAHAFAEQFANWGLRLPEHRQASGTITGGGWVVNYRYMREEGEERLYYFASHRMTNDSLFCVHADGRSETVDECQEFYVVGEEEARRSYFATNRRFYDRVRELGLFEPAAVATRINALLRSGEVEEGDDAKPPGD
jgi:hypothetical protein